MSRDSYRKCSACGGYHWVSEWPHNHVEGERERSPLAAPMVISDTMEAVRSMADGKMYSSKAALRSTYRPSGNPDGISYIEVGNDQPKTPVKPKTDEGAIQVSLQKAMARYERGERV